MIPRLDLHYQCTSPRFSEALSETLSEADFPLGDSQSCPLIFLQNIKFTFGLVFGGSTFFWVIFDYKLGQCLTFSLNLGYSRAHAKGVVLCERTWLCPLSTF